MKNVATSFRNSSNSVRVGGRFATIYPKRNPERNRIIIYTPSAFYMLCLGFTCMLFVLHIFKLRSPTYRRQTTHQKINQCYLYLHICARALTLFYSSHHILKHFALVHPTPNVLLWVVPETRGFNMVLASSMVHPHLGLVVACTYPLTPLESVVIFGTIYRMSHADK